MKPKEVDYVVYQKCLKSIVEKSDYLDIDHNFKPLFLLLRFMNHFALLGYWTK